MEIFALLMNRIFCIICVNYDSLQVTYDVATSLSILSDFPKLILLARLLSTNCRLVLTQDHKYYKTQNQSDCLGFTSSVYLP